MLDFGLFERGRLPFVAASELNECGLACLASVAQFLRGPYSLNDIRQRAQHSGRGETLLELRNLAQGMGLSARGVKVDLAGLKALRKPAILHWEMNHFVVLERVTRRGLIIMDPAAGRIAVPWKKAHAAFTGVAMELAPTAEWERSARPPRQAGVLDFIRPVSRWRADIAVIVLLSLLLEFLVLLMPFQLQAAVDHAVQSGDGRLVWILAISFGAIALIMASVSLVRAWASTVFSTRLGFDLYDRFVSTLHRKPPMFFLKHHTGDILHRARSVNTIQAMVTARLVQAMLDGVMSLVLLAVVLLMVPAMGLIVLAFGVLNVGFSATLRQAAVDTARRQLRTAALADSLFLENARAARALRLFGKERVRTNLWRNKFAELTNLSLRSERLMMYSTEVAQFTGHLGGVLLIGCGTYLVLQGAITLGTMLMVVLMRTFFVDRINNCVNYLMELRRLQSHAERIDEVVGAPRLTDTTAEAEPPRPFAVPPQAGMTIEVKDVWFRYGADSPWILKGVSLTIAPGEAVALTGPSGCGKTTLLGVMLGLLEPTRGEVLINGRDLRSISPHDYARQIGVVMQDDILFHGTVAENIAFFEMPIDGERVRRCAAQANIAADIETMPMGYYSLLAEAAADISGGQKQRLFIARALYHRPRILFLDEATSHLDTESERLVSEAVRRLPMTRVLIAHRRETIATAQRVVAMRDGKLDEVPPLTVLSPVNIKAQ